MLEFDSISREHETCRGKVYLVVRGSSMGSLSNGIGLTWRLVISRK